MTYTWIYIMLLMFAGSFILQMVPLLFYFEAVIAVNLLILAASWFILRRDRFSDFRSVRGCCAVCATCVLRLHNPGF